MATVTTISVAALVLAAMAKAKDDPPLAEPAGPVTPREPAVPLVTERPVSVARRPVPVPGSYTDAARCVRTLSITTDARGVRIERDMMTRPGRRTWGRHVEAARARLAAANAQEADLLSKP